ncbi:aminotransferase class IV, partial [Candidatus Micrarchaeota archaeon]|nr:aminotransferase class IV [Candidatus Micrarchaeota archaeon]
MFIRNGLFIPPEKAVLPISHIEFSYGFGVYESIRVRRKKPFFAMDHAERLLQSAQIIGLDHSFSAKQILD